MDHLYSNMSRSHEGLARVHTYRTSITNPVYLQAYSNEKNIRLYRIRLLSIRLHRVHAKTSGSGLILGT